MASSITKADVVVRIDAEPLLTLIVPVYNEQATVAAVLDAVTAEPTTKEIIVVDDGSSDGSDSAIGEWFISSAAWREPAGSGSNVCGPHADAIRLTGPQADAERLTTTVRFIWIRHAENAGKGTAIRTALAFANGEYVVVQDADLEVSPSAYPTLLRPLLSGEADLVMGRRRGLMPRGRLFLASGVRLLNLTTRLLYQYRVADAACCFKVLARENLTEMRLECERFEFCPEVLAKAARMKLRLAEVDVEYKPRGDRSGKKLRLVKDGIAALQTLWRLRRWQLNENVPDMNQDQHQTEQEELSRAEALRLAEQMAWMIFLMTPIVWWLQGESVSPDQFVVRTSLLVLSGLAAVGLRLRARLRAEAESQS